MGYVYHSWNRKSIYQNIGNFFIGAGPIIFGSVVLFSAMYFLLPNAEQALTAIFGYDATKFSASNIHASLNDVLHYALTLVGVIFSPANFTSYKFWIFLYISMCISAHMGLSLPDLKGMWLGFIFILLISFILNAAALAIKIDISNYTMTINHQAGILAAILIFATILSLINCFFTVCVLSIVRIFKR